MRRRSAYVTRVPVALVLAAGYAYTAVILADHGFIENSRIDRYGWGFSVVSAVFALWHAGGYFGFIRDGWRKVGYLVSAAWLGGFALALWHDGAHLGAGYSGIACGMALAAYWKYPRRSEIERHVE